MGVKKITRLLRLLIAIQSESLNSFEELMDDLKVSRRTLYRDLGALNEAGIPCYFDRSQQCYRVDSSFYMPPPNLTTQEAFSLLLLVRKAREKLEMPFSDSALQGALKIENNLSPAIRKYCRQVLKNISIQGTCAKLRDSIDEKFDSFQQAILRKQVLKLTYNSKAGPSVTTCDFSPLHLLYTDSWYVMGKLNLGRQIQSIKLKDIEKIEKTGKYYLDEENFDPSDHLGRAWATMPEGTLYNVKLRFAPEIAHDVTSKQWHSTQYATIEKDGSALLEFRVDGLGEITWWIISFADKVEVLEPQALRQIIHNMAEKMVKRSKISEKKSDSLSAIMKNISA